MASVANAAKLLARMRSNPRGDWTIDDMKTVASHFGIDYEPRRHEPLRVSARSGWAHVGSRAQAAEGREGHVINEYPFCIRPLSAEEGGGYLIEFPDLPGCVADGSTPEEAISEGQDAVQAYVASCRKHGDTIPVPGSFNEASGQWRQRVPKSLHARLTARARQEGVSLNSLVMAMIAEGLGRRESRKP